MNTTTCQPLVLRLLFRASNPCDLGEALTSSPSLFQSRWSPCRLRSKSIPTPINSQRTSNFRVNSADEKQRPPTSPCAARCAFQNLTLDGPHWDSEISGHGVGVGGLLKEFLGWRLLEGQPRRRGQHRLPTRDLGLWSVSNWLASAVSLTFVTPRNSFLDFRQKMSKTGQNWPQYRL